MFSLIKQVFKSLKNSILLFFGLIFISLVVVFASSASLYFSSNVNHSYKTLLKESRHSDVALDISNDNLRNENLNSGTIHDLFFKYFGVTDWKKPEDVLFLKKPNENGEYFSDINEYRDYKYSFMYQPVKLSKSKFFIQDIYGRNGKTYLFPFFDGNINNNGEFLKDKPREENGQLSEEWDTEIDASKKNKWFQHKDINHKKKKIHC